MTTVPSPAAEEMLHKGGNGQPNVSNDTHSRPAQNAKNDDSSLGISKFYPTCSAGHLRGGHDASRSQPLAGQSPDSLSPSVDTVSPANVGTTENSTEDSNALSRTPSGPPHTILSERAKIATILLASFSAFISPVSGAIYFPAINTLAVDLGVSVSLINLTITTYMIFQGLAPSLIGNFSDELGRRPAFMICLIIYTAACLGLALQTSYPALAVLRCLQSSGSSGTVILALGIVADLVTRAERGKYVGWASLGVTLGPALGPLIGGLLSHFQGWRAIFWFLSIYAAVILLLILTVLPETSRNVVGNGSVPAQWWNKSLIGWLTERKIRKAGVVAQAATLERKRKKVNPVASLLVVLNKEEGTILLMGSLIFGGFYAVLSSLSPILRNSYGLNDLKIGACYIPYGVGSLVSRWTLGRIVDWNFARHAKKLGMEIKKNRQQNLDDFPIERVRLEVALPTIYIGCAVVIIYSWMLEIKAPLPAPLVFLFFIGYTLSGSFSMMNTLVVDLNHKSPATAMAGNNLVRCAVGAGAVAAAVPLINKIGIGWTGTFVAGLWVVTSPLLWVVMKYGTKWRREKRLREEAKEKEEAEKEKGGDPEKQ